MSAVPSGLPLLIDRLSSALGRDHVDLSQPPRILCRPGSAAEVTEVLTSAALAQVAASCHGAPEAMLHLDLSRLQGLCDALGAEALAEPSLICEVKAGTPLLALELLLRERRMTLGPLPARCYGRSLGAALAAPRPSEASTALGRLRDRVLRLSAVLPPGSPARAGDAGAAPGAGYARAAALPVALSPRRAVGPDLKQLLIGTEGRLGVITAAALQATRRPVETRCAGWLFDGAGPAMALLQEAQQLHGGLGLADAQVASRAYLQRALAAVAPAEAHEVPEAGAVALLVRCDTLPELATALLGRLAARAAAHGGQALAESLPLPLLWADPAGEEARRAALAAATPAHEVALPVLAAALLAERFSAATAGGGAALLCGIHLHGAALCADSPQAGAEPGDGAALLGRVRDRLAAGLLR